MTKDEWGYRSMTPAPARALWVLGAVCWLCQWREATAPLQQIGGIDAVQRRAA